MLTYNAAIVTVLHIARLLHLICMHEKLMTCLTTACMQVVHVYQPSAARKTVKATQPL